MRVGGKRASKAKYANPGLRYYYPLPKIENPKNYEFDIVIYGASPAAISAA